ncbi:MAG: SRPBCC domain-containing protein [Brevundimonas sp.]
MVMRAPDGSDHPFDGRFVSLDEPEQLVMRTWIDRADGTRWFEVEQTVHLDERDGRTVLRFEATVIAAGADALGPLSGMEAGWNGSLDKLEAHVRAVTGG